MGSLPDSALTVLLFQNQLHGLAVLDRPSFILVGFGGELSARGSVGNLGFALIM